MPRFSSVLPLLLAAGAALPGAPPDKVQEDAVIEAGRRGAKAQRGRAKRIPGIRKIRQVLPRSAWISSPEPFEAAGLELV